MRWLSVVITMYDQLIKLVTSKKTLDDHGDHVVEHTERQVLAELMSIGQSEFYQAQAVGLKPELKFKLPDYLEYQNEKHLKYQGFNETEEQLYTVIRTFRNGNELEIVCKRGVD